MNSGVETGNRMNKKLMIAAFIVITLAGAALFISIDRKTRPKAVIAFVIDDWGYNMKYIDLVSQIDRPLTISILPNLRYSSYIARMVKKNNSLDDIILHLPLESKSGRAAERNTILSSMDKGQILSILRDDIDSLPGIVGVSNHQGSKATEDKRVMRIVFGELKNRGLFFLDSLTTPNSVCSEVARAVDLRYTVRDVFLDITDKTDLEDLEGYIRQQIDRLSKVALTEGMAIGVGHNIKITLIVIKDSIPRLEREGIKIVPLKELVK